MHSIIPQDVEEAWRLAKMAFRSGLLKRQKVRTVTDDGKSIYQDEDDDACISRGTMKVLQGLEVGMPPMAALQLIELVGSRLVVHSEGVPGILWAKGFKLREWTEGEGDDRVAYCELTRPDGEKILRSFSVAQAKKAKLWSPGEKITKKGKNGSVYEAENDSTWHRFDFRMLQMRARGYAANDGGSDAMRGIGVRELVEDANMIDITGHEQPARRIEIEDIPDETAQAEAVAPDEVNQDTEPLANVGVYLANLEEEMAVAGDLETLGEIWEAHSELANAGRFAGDDQLKAEALFEKHEKRLKGKKGK